jgi:hypothetical protein
LVLTKITAVFKRSKCGIQDMKFGESWDVIVHDDCIYNYVWNLANEKTSED